MEAFHGLEQGFNSLAAGSIQKATIQNYKLNFLLQLLFCVFRADHHLQEQPRHLLKLQIWLISLEEDIWYSNK